MLHDLFDILTNSNFNDTEALRFIKELQMVDSGEWEEFLKNKAEELELCEACFHELERETRLGMYILDPRNILYEENCLICRNCGWSNIDL